VDARSAHARLTSRPRTAPGTPARAGTRSLDDVGLPGTLLHVPAQVARPAPLLVFFHGAGGAGATSLPILRADADRTGALVLLPTSSGSTWDLLVSGLGRDVAALDLALGTVFAEHDVAQVAFGGFSDGASYGLSLGLRNGDLAQTLLAFSPGFAAPPGMAGHPRVWVSHGTAAAGLPIDRCGRAVVRRLREVGLDVTFEEFAGGHVVPPHLVAAAFDWWLAPSPG
jgi:predicted esterase